MYIYIFIYVYTCVCRSIYLSMIYVYIYVYLKEGPAICKSGHANIFHGIFPCLTFIFMIWVRTSRVRTQTIHIILPNIKKIACSKDPQPCRNTLIASLSGECPGYSLHWSCHNSRLWYLEGSLEPGTKLPSMQGIPRMCVLNGENVWFMILYADFSGKC